MLSRRRRRRRAGTERGLDAAFVLRLRTDPPCGLRTRTRWRVWRRLSVWAKSRGLGSSCTAEADSAFLDKHFEF